ncbi:MAG TPA: hypothetical protein VE960_04535 [bacterium]|nr:hypothetical protein [bacterium]
MEKENRERDEEAQEHSSRGSKRSPGGMRGAMRNMRADDMWKMMSGMTTEDMSRMMRECCPDEVGCDACDWMLRRMFADSQEDPED